ncbi:MAG: ribonuclease H-like domain-containing protein [Candidatus Komeilibacteria bacterium]|nr:ribonuclease H-like domain-containing protein [Candidatus Komeilibacteria bacterium]
MNDKLVLDLETKQTFEDVGGHHNSHKLGVSLVGVYSYASDEYRGFRENEMDALRTWLEAADLIIGFNSKHFDFTVLQPYYPKFDLSKLSHLDILEEVVYSLGHRLKLETIAQATLGHGKSGDGLDAIKYFQQGDWTSLEKYCLDDVKVTKDIYDYGLAHGYIWFANNGVKEKIKVRWAQGETVEDVVNRAVAKGLQLEIEYIDDDGSATTRTIDIQRVQENKIKAYCHLRQGLRVFDLTKIRKAKDVGPMSSFQKTLL